MKRKLLTPALIIFLLAAFPSLLLAGSAILHWQAVSAPDLAGYRVYYGTSSRSYGPYIPIGSSVTSYTLNGLVDGRTYYFALTAVDTSGNESGYSAEVSKTISTSQTTTSALELFPATGAYGMIKGGDQTHVNNVAFSFPGSAGNFILGYEAWDVDYSTEVKIALNGHQLGYVPVTGNRAWGPLRRKILPDKWVNDTGTNVLKFSNTGNPPNKYSWGVRNVSFLDASEICIPLPASGSYGLITGGDQNHINKVLFSFTGSPGNQTLRYEAWDVDSSTQLKIVLNGHTIGYAPVTGNNAWGGTQTIVLPDKWVSDAGTNILKFNNTKNPPHRNKWGVRNVQLQ
jgi:hypothetical protein